MDKIKAKIYLPNADFSQVELTEVEFEVLPQTSDFNLEFIYTLPAALYNKLVDTSDRMLSYKNYMLRKKEIESRKLQLPGQLEGLDYLKTYVTSTLPSLMVEEINKLSQQAVLPSLMVEEINKLSQQAVYLETFKELQKTKKIFVRFNSTIGHDRYEVNHAYQGVRIQFDFQFFIGYEVEEQDGWWHENTGLVKNYYTKIQHYTGSLASKSTNFKEGPDMIVLHDKSTRGRSTFTNSHHILNWTQEREDFFTNIQKNFENLNNKLNGYFNNINEDNINFIISNGQLSLSSTTTNS